MTLLSALWYGWADISEAYSRRVLWWNLAREDITELVHKTLLGPLWILLSFVIFLLSIFAVVGNRDISFLAYMALGLLVWNYISEVMIQSPQLFFRESAFVRGTTLPLSIYAFQLTGRSVIRLGYSLAACLAIILFTTMVPIPAALASVPGLILVIITAPAVVIVLAVLGVLLPDIEFVIQNAIRILFFLSPIFWYPSRGDIRGFLHDFNPLSYYIEIVREPIVYGVISGRYWIVALSMSVAIWLVAIALLGRFRDRIVFLV